MNPWDIVWVILTWAFALLALAGGLILVFGAVVGIVRGVRQWFRKTPNLEGCLRDANAFAEKLYSDEIIMKAEVIQSFVDGACWGWGYNRRK